MKLVNEDKYGAYLGASPAFFKKFDVKESNPNFDVFDAKDGSNRFIAVKCSRLPDDEDPAAGNYGINFHRAKPDFAEARQFRKEFPASLWSQKNIHHLAFAAADESEYRNKSAAWEKFYSYVWGQGPLTIWVTPHSGIAARKPDADFPYPKLEMDGFVAGVAARCAFNNNQPAKKRTMASVHSHNWHGAIFDLGGFGVMEKDKLSQIAAAVEEKYHDAVQRYAGACLLDSQERALGWLKFIYRLRGTLDPQELAQKHLTDHITVRNIIQGLKLYGITINHFTLDEFKAAFASLQQKEIRVASCNHIFAAELIGQQLDLRWKISGGHINAALQIECMKFYLQHAPEFMSEIILDIVRGLTDL